MNIVHKYSLGTNRTQGQYAPAKRLFGNISGKPNDLSRQTSISQNQNQSSNDDSIQNKKLKVDTSKKSPDNATHYQKDNTRKESIVPKVSSQNTSPVGRKHKNTTKNLPNKTPMKSNIEKTSTTNTPNSMNNISDQVQYEDDSVDEDETFDINNLNIIPMAADFQELISEEMHTFESELDYIQQVLLQQLEQCEHIHNATKQDANACFMAQLGQFDV